MSLYCNNSKNESIIIFLIHINEEDTATELDSRIGNLSKNIR